MSSTSATRADTGGTGARFRLGLLLVVVAVAGCGDDRREGPPALFDQCKTGVAVDDGCYAARRDSEDPCGSDCLAPREHASPLVAPSQRDALAARAEHEPYASILAAIRAHAAEDLELEAEGEPWDPKRWGRNGRRAVANAFLAWLFDDLDAGERARAALLALEPRLSETTVWDANIRMPRVSINFADAWDLMMATGFMSADEGAEVAHTITTLNQQLYERFVLDPIGRGTTIYISQNNHSIRTASALGYVALAFPEHPQSKTWLDFATSEIAYLYGPDGHYLQADGGVSEGAFYYSFGLAAALPFLIRYDARPGPGQVQRRTCLNRIDKDPWGDHGCVDGEAFVFENPLHDPLFLSAADWAVSLRLPDGFLPPVEDARFRPLNGPALMTRYGGGSHLVWAWHEVEDRPMEMTAGMDLAVYHYALLDDTVAPTEPPWRNRFHPQTGNAVLRSDHGPDARWLLLVAEPDSARKTLHDHVDSTSFSMAAYGDYLLIDSGYYSDDPVLNSATSGAASHNLILVDGEALEKGEFHDWQGADAALRNTLDGEAVAWAEAHQSYLETDFERGVALVRGRYFVVADQLDTDAPGPREHRWRAHAGAGYDLGGTFELDGDALRVEAETGGVLVRVDSTEGPVVFEEPPFEELEPPHVHDLRWGAAHHGVADGVISGLSPDFLAILAPYARDAEPGSPDAELRVTRVEAGADAVAWLVESTEGTDLAWLRGSDAASELTLADGTCVTTDARFAIVALDGSFALLTRGSTVSLDGAALIEGETRDVTSTEGLPRGRPHDD